MYVAFQHGYGLNIDVAKKLVEKSVPSNKCLLNTAQKITNNTLYCIRYSKTHYNYLGEIDDECVKNIVFNNCPVEGLIPHGIYT